MLRKIFVLFFGLVLAQTSVAAEAGNALKEQLLARAAQAKEGDYAFTRTTKSEASIGEGSHSLIEKYDPKVKWTLVSVDGRPPSAAEANAYGKDNASRRVPGYGRIGAYLANAVAAPADDRGRALFHFSSLPKQTVLVLGSDVSGRAAGDLFVNNSGATPFVEEVRVKINQTIRIKLIAKVESWEGTTHYRLGKDGQPFPAEQTSDVVGSMLGKSGKIHSVSTYSDVHRASE